MEPQMNQIPTMSTGAGMGASQMQQPLQSQGGRPIGWIAATVFFCLSTIVLGVFTFLPTSGLVGEPNTVKEEPNGEPKQTDDCVKCEEMDGVTQVKLFYEKGVAVLYNGEVFVNVEPTDGHYDAVKANQGLKKVELGNTVMTKMGNSDFIGAKLNTKNIVKIFDYMAGQAVDESKYGLLLLNESGEIEYITNESLKSGNYNTKKIATDGEVVDVTSADENYGVETYAELEDGSKVAIRELL